LETTTWGWFNNAQPPVLHVESGDTIIFETMMHSHNQIVPGTTIEQIKKLRTDYPGRGPHTLTGPVYIEGAEPGMVLKVKINKIVPRAYAMNFNVPGMFGQFPDRFPEGQVKYFYLDLDRKVAEFAPGIEIPLRFQVRRRSLVLSLANTAPCHLAAMPATSMSEILPRVRPSTFQFL
jgi:acetamidase/formamidase